MLANHYTLVSQASCHVTLKGDTEVGNVGYLPKSNIKSGTNMFWSENLSRNEGKLCIDTMNNMKHKDHELHHLLPAVKKHGYKRVMPSM